MPDNVVIGLANKSGKSVDVVEKAWEDATKDYLDKNGKKKDDLTGKDWGILVGITKNKLGIKESVLEAYLKSKKSAKMFFEVDTPIENPGILGVPEGKSVDSLPQDHFQKLIVSKGWDEISKALMNLVRFNKNKDTKLSNWADSMQASLSDWVDEKRKSNSNFGK